MLATSIFFYFHNNAFLGQIPLFELHEIVVFKCLQFNSLPDDKFDTLPN